MPYYEEVKKALKRTFAEIISPYYEEMEYFKRFGPEAHVTIKNSILILEAIARIDHKLNLMYERMDKIDKRLSFIEHIVRTGTTPLE